MEKQKNREHSIVLSGAVMVLSIWAEKWTYQEKKWGRWI